MSCPDSYRGVSLCWILTCRSKSRQKPMTSCSLLMSAGAEDGLAELAGALYSSVSKSDAAARALSMTVCSRPSMTLSKALSNEKLKFAMMISWATPLSWHSLGGATQMRTREQIKAGQLRERFRIAACCVPLRADLLLHAFQILWPRLAVRFSLSCQAVSTLFRCQ